MHLLIVTQYYPPEMGAPQARLSELAQRFVCRGHKVTVLTAMPNYPTGKIHPAYRGVLKREVVNGVNIVRTLIYPTQKADLLRRLLNYGSFVLSSSVVGMFIHRPDFVMVESPPLLLGLSALWLSWVKRCRLIANISDLWPDSVVRLGKVKAGGFFHKLSCWIEANLYHRAWLVTGQSEGILADINTRFPGVREFHLSNGVDPNLFCEAKRSEAWRNSVAPRHDFLVTYAGLHGLAQGLDQVLIAAKLLKDEEDICFVLVGDGPEKAYLKQVAIDLNLKNVVFSEPIPRSGIPALLKSSDLILAPLKINLPGAVPSKIYEAMGAGVPVVVVADGEPAQIVRQTGTGVAVSVNAPQDLVRAILEMRDNPANRTEMGEAGLRAAREIYNRDLIVDRFIEYLEAACS